VDVVGSSPNNPSLLNRYLDAGISIRLSRLAENQNKISQWSFMRNFGAKTSQNHEIRFGTSGSFIFSQGRDALECCASGHTPNIDWPANDQ
jgi:hypothetical protein